MSHNILVNWNLLHKSVYLYIKDSKSVYLKRRIFTLVNYKFKLLIVSLCHKEGIYSFSNKFDILYIKSFVYISFNILFDV